MSLENSFLKNLRVLYVEDEEEILKQMIFFLKKRVGKLIVAQDGVKGLEAFKEYRPDIIISDLKMPSMDGLSMAREIRKISDVPIIITTAFSDKEIILQAVDVGIESYIVKPINVRELMKSISKTGTKILRGKGQLLAVRNRALSNEAKLNIEEQIKNAIGKFIKDRTGKGPQSVKVFIHSSGLEIELVKSLTKMEKTLLEWEKNISIVKYYRETFYKDHEQYMKEIIEKYLVMDTKLEFVEMDLLNDKILLNFTICD